MKRMSSLEYNTLVWFLIRAGYVGLSLNNVLIISHQDSLFSGLVALFLGIIPLFCFMYLRNYNPDKNIIELNMILFKKNGIFINLLLFIGSFIIATIYFVNLIYFVNSQFLFKTKAFIISICLIIPIIYALLKGTVCVARASLIMFYFVIIAIIVIILGLSGEVSIDNLKPLFQTDYSKVFSGSLVLIAYNVLPLFFLLSIPRNSIYNYGGKKTIMFYIVAMMSIINAIFLTLSVLGPDLALLYEYPEFHVLKKVKVGEFVDRLENLLSWEWIVAIFIVIIFATDFMVKVIKDIFKTNEKTDKKVIFLICFVIFLISQYILSMSNASSSFFKSTMVILMYFFFLILPIVTILKARRF